jgi:mRNA interferase MazF
MVSEGDIVVARLPQADGGSKLRPVVLLRELPGFGDYLVCGVSSQVRHAVEGFDVVIEEGDEAFEGTGLRVSSVLRLAFMAVVPVDRMKSKLGRLPRELLVALQISLARHLTSQQKP